MGHSKRKIDGYTIYAAAVVLFGVAACWWMFYDIGYSSGRHQERAHVESEHYAADASRYLSEHCGTLAGAALRKCIYEAAQTEREGQHNESDLAAQWKAADWVLWAAIISGAQLIFTIIGLYFVK